MITSKTYSRIALWAMWLIFITIMLSCNPYKRLGSRPPLTAKDSAALLTRCVQLIPLDTANPFVPPVIDRPDSTGYFKAIADSLALAKQTVRDSLLIKYKDTCTSAKAIFDRGFKLGEDKGFNEGKAKSEQDVTGYYKKYIRNSDSLHLIQYNALKRGYNIRLEAAQNSQGIAEKDRDKYRGKADKWKTAFIWAAGLAALFLIILIIMILWRRKTKAARKILS